jgi:predicted phosphodiesterase
VADFSEELVNLAKSGPTGSDTKQTNTPESWRPRVEVGPDGGFIISTANTEGNTPGAEEILRERGLDPEEWIVTSVRKGAWQTFHGDWLESVRVNIKPARLVVERDFDLEQLVEHIQKWRPEKGIKMATGLGAYAHVGADKQIGKKAGSGGTDQTVGRILEATEASIQKFKGYQKMGLSFGTILLPEVGDHVEGNVSQGGRLQGLAASDLGQTEQVRVARRMLLNQVKAFAPLAERIIVPVINGNHDEVTRQVAADPADGWNVEIASAVQDACAENPALQHVEFRFPASGHQTLAVDVDGTLLGLFHGHQFSRDVEKYLNGQAMGQTAIGGADVWISGHYHHFKSQDVGSRLWVQAPTVDPGSDWYRDRTGASSLPGVLTMVLGGDYDPREFISIIGVK